MSGTYRFSWLRPGGWLRLGVAGAVAVMFGTPMMWALGVFGQDEGALRQAVVFLLSGLWFFIAVGYTIGWAIRGFVVRVKESDDEEDHPPARGPAPPHRPGH